MSIIGNLNNPNFKVTKSDRLVINYILNNLDKVPYFQISELAREAGTAESTVTRCVKKLGCRGYQDFKVGIAKEVSVKKQNSILNGGIIQGEPAIETAAKMAKSSINSIDQTLKLVDGKVIENIASKILEAKKIYFIGIGFSGIIAADTNYKFMRIGLNSISMENPHMMMGMASIMQKGDIVISISNSGETADLIDVVNLARKNGAQIVSLTSNRTSSLARSSDICMCSYSLETEQETGSIDAKISQYFIMDLLYTEVVKQSMITSTSNKLKTTDAIKKLNIRYQP